MNREFKLHFRKIKYAAKDFPILKLREWLPYISNFLRYGWHKNHIRHQPISHVRTDRFMRYLTETLSENDSRIHLLNTLKRTKPISKVLITNSTIGGRSGTEVWIYEIANWLKNKGIDVLVYAPNLNTVNIKAADSISYTTDQDIARLFTPDLIHVQHAGHHKVAELLYSIPNVPVFNLLHGVIDQIEMPLKGTEGRPVLYGGVSRLICRKTNFLTNKNVILLKNFAENLSTFRNNPDLVTACCVSTKISTDVRSRLTQLFGAQGILLKSVGHDLESFIWDYRSQGNDLKQSDVVLCTGKTAVDALGMGIHVILCEGSLLGPLVTHKNIDFLSAMNFALASEAVQVIDVFSSEAEYWLERQLDGLPLIDPECMQTFLRKENSIDSVGKKLLEIYGILAAQSS